MELGEVGRKECIDSLDVIEAAPHQHPSNGVGDAKVLDQVLDGIFIDTFPEIPPIVQRIPANLKIFTKVQPEPPSVNIYSHFFHHVNPQEPTDDPEHRDEGAYRARSRDLRKRQERVKTRRKELKSLPESALPGIVITSVGPFWLVSQTDGGLDNLTDLYVCTVSGTVDSPETDTIITVGDRVWLVPDDEDTEFGHPSAHIVKREERETLLSRKAAGRQQREQVVVANVEQLGIVVAARQPEYHKRLIDRYLIAADKGDLRPLIIVNKLDLVPSAEREDLVEDLAAYWDDLDLPVVFLSAETGENVRDLHGLIRDRSTLLSGPSGVGKSSLINALTDARLRVGEISEMYQKGKHTTTAATVIPLPEGGQLVDSPGLREFAVWELDADELPYYFEEFEPYMQACRFQPCTHDHEPGCAVKEAVEQGKIDPERYLSYLVLLEELHGTDPRK